jgi:hypothetical protein
MLTGGGEKLPAMLHINRYTWRMWLAFYLFFLICIYFDRVTRWRSWVRHCATSRKVVGSIPDGVIGIFH